MRARRGSILVAVLLMASLLVVFVGVASQRTWVASAAARSAAEDIAADVAVRGAVEQLFARTGGHFGDLASVATVTYPGIVVDIVAADEGRRIDLNMAAPELIAGLFRVAGVGAAEATSYARVIADWRRDPKDKSKSRKPPSVPPHGIIEHMRQLDTIPRIPPEAIRAIAPWATVTGLTGKVAVLSAPAPVVAALPGMDPGRVEAFLQDRVGWDGKFETLIKRYGIVADHVSKDGSTATRLTMTVRIGSHRIRGYEVVVAVIPDDDEPYRILSWNGYAQTGGTMGR